MKMYSYGSSFEANLTLQTPNSFRDVSFSCYLNKDEETMIRELTNQASQLPESEDENEIGVFGAEKYFKWELEDHAINNNDPRFIDTNTPTNKMHHQVEKVEEFDHIFPAKLTADQTSMRTPSVRSNVSSNRSKTRAFLARFGSNCVNKKSIQINEKRFINAKEISKPQSSSILDFDQITAETKTRNDYFSFPVLNPNDLNSNSSSNSKSGNLAGKFLGDNNWDMEVPTEDEMYYNNDVDSDSSSDLFEIESFPATGNGSRSGHRKPESNCYAPSEVSVDWSVVTASAADFSVVSDYDGVWTGGGGWRDSGRNAQVREKKEKQKKRSSFLSGCASHDAVRVAGNEYKVSGGGAGGRRRRLSDSMAIGSMFRGGII